MNRLALPVTLVFAVLSAACAPVWAEESPNTGNGSAIFLHPDGMGANTWTAVRLIVAGPDGRLHWDNMERTAAYAGPMLDSVTASSNGGGTSHAWGVRAESESFGTVGGQRIAASRSGAAVPLMIEAQSRGKAIGLVNTASITDAGTGTQIASVESRKDDAGIALQLFEARPEVLLGGGEAFFLPEGVTGVHGPGQRKDGRNLIEEARAEGYVIVRTRDELLALPPDTHRVLGLFAAEATFNEGSEEALAAAGLPVFSPLAPRYEEMVRAALVVLAHDPDGFYLMAEEEASDNMAGDNNAGGVIEAASGADRALGHALSFAAGRGDVTVVVASDSDCGGLQVTGDDVVAGSALSPVAENGSPQDGVSGTASMPFMAAPDRAGRAHPFAVSWASSSDMSGGGVVRAQGPGADIVRGTLDSTDIYAVLYLGLFGVHPDEARVRH